MEKKKKDEEKGTMSFFSEDNIEPMRERERERERLLRPIPTGCSVHVNGG
jgi:hypothetical protein